ncbi:MAG: methyltransferase domain-containing protein [Gammaproteobacteria bacterium]|nr:methyltransferase domain-containing protein [Gammaproteobacteria bacterium]MCP5201296.1 methyltransferase domain-containing protein [Gammaproteobacteria bacterium]
MAKVGDIIDAHNADWRFSGAASTHFDAHVARSVPFYAETHELVLRLSDFFVHEDSRVYDLGCATGGLLAGLAARHGARRLRLVGIDCEPDMVRLARQRCAEHAGCNIEQDNLATYAFEPCDLVVACYTLQFVPPRVRQQVFDAIYGALEWGGAFVLFEKVRAPDARFQDIMSALYVDHKLEQGYSGDEIVAKARSLKGVLEPFSREGNLGLLERAGFVDVMSVFKYVCFEGFLAIK